MVVVEVVVVVEIGVEVEVGVGVEIGVEVEVVVEIGVEVVVGAEEPLPVPEQEPMNECWTDWLIQCDYEQDRTGLDASVLSQGEPTPTRYGHGGTKHSSVQTVHGFQRYASTVCSRNREWGTVRSRWRGNSVFRTKTNKLTPAGHVYAKRRILL